MLGGEERWRAVVSSPPCHNVCFGLLLFYLLICVSCLHMIGIYTCIHVYTDIWKYVYAYIRVYIYIYMYIYTYVCRYKCMYMYI